MKNNIMKQGFTIVEIMIVIIVIGILASITIVSYSGVQNRSKATVIANDIKSLEKALKAFASDEQRTTWWEDDTNNGKYFPFTPSSGTGENPLVSDIIQNTNLKDYFEGLSATTSSNTTEVKYDNDGNTYDGCSTDSGGVNLYFYAISSKVASEIDSSIDDGNPTCGKVTLLGADMRYNLDNDQNID